jgi:type IV pilus assembly protein PilQ
MPHFFSPALQQGNETRSCCFFYYTVLLVVLLIGFSAQAAEDGAANEKIVISGLSTARSGKNLEISIHCTAEFKPMLLRLTNPARIAVDISGGEIKRNTELTLPDAYNIEVQNELMQEVTPALLRILFKLPRLYAFTSKSKGNDIVITLEDFFTEEQVGAEEKKESSSAAETAGNPSSASKTASLTEPEKEEEAYQESSIDKHLPDINILNPVAGGSQADSSRPGEKKAGESEPIGDTATISVDFYKIDLHNVFRMLREITGKNIVIAGGVSGNLTLALTDVPWRFALDIILNLKDLAKIERDNTIVVYPKDKEFVWPEREEDTLSIEVNDDIISKEGIIIKQEKDTPPEQLEAKKLIANGRAAEKKGDLETAVRFYEKALNKWPETKLATKVSTTYLAQLNQNAKAVFFAKKALEADKKNSAAALNAAIGYANMEDFRQAQQYFDQSVNTGKPSREALISYAAFSERQRQYDAALRLLKKLEDLYGQDLNSMVAQARIHDALGDYGAARKQYQAILHAGFRVPPDLKKFILSKTGNN